MATKKTLYRRQMTICSKSFSRENGCYVQLPVITLSGKWLRQTGFKIGHVIDIHYEYNKLIITVAENQRFDIKE